MHLEDRLYVRYDCGTGSGFNGWSQLPPPPPKLQPSIKTQLRRPASMY
jgi:hypothetical protein